MIKEYLEIINNKCSQVYLVTGISPKLLSIEELTLYAGNSIAEYGNINIILSKLLKTQIDGILLVTGSFYIMDEAYNTIKSLIE